MVPMTMTMPVALVSVLLVAVPLVVRVQEELDRPARLHHAVAPGVRHVVRRPQLALGVDVAVAAVHDAVGPAVLVVELPVRAHLVPVLVSTCIIEVLLMVLRLVLVFDVDYHFFATVSISSGILRMRG